MAAVIAASWSSSSGTHSAARQASDLPYPLLGVAHMVAVCVGIEIELRILVALLAVLKPEEELPDPAGD
jgi:hypothetical protein